MPRAPSPAPRSARASSASGGANAKAPRLPPWPGQYYAGIDENGMGPRLGPLIVTSVLARATPAGAKVVTSKARGASAARIGDSKKLVAFDDSALGEAWARAIEARTAGPDDELPRTPAALLRAIGLDDEDVLRAPCPTHHADMCWGDEEESFVSTPEAVEACSRDLDQLAARGVEITRARVAVVCTRRLNEAVHRGLSRFDVDLHTMERLTLDAVHAAGDEVYALCGKVGGFDFYGERFGPLSGRLFNTLVEGRAWSEYHVAGVGRLAFIRDADDSQLLVSLASLVGKWARDHLMRRVIRFHRAHDAALPNASGYHDPITTRFIEASALIRRQRRVEELCFERTSLGALSASPKTAPKARKPKPQALPKGQASQQALPKP